MRFEPKYNRMHSLEMWSENWIIDNKGNLVFEEEGITVENMRFND